MPQASQKRVPSSNFLPHLIQITEYTSFLKTTVNSLSILRLVYYKKKGKYHFYTVWHLPNLEGKSDKILQPRYNRYNVMNRRKTREKTSQKRSYVKIKYVGRKVYLFPQDTKNFLSPVFLSTERKFYGRPLTYGRLPFR